MCGINRSQWRRKIIKFMVKWPILIFIGSAIFIESCAHNYDIKSSVPCFEPYKKYTYKVCNNFTFAVDDKFYTIPKGFETDFASIPRPLWSFISPSDSQTIRASVIHDYLYSKNVNVERSYADNVFYDVLRQDGVSRPKSWIYWFNVRLFGWEFFKKK